MTDYRNIPEFVPNSPTTGNIIQSAHIRNIENFLGSLIEIVDENGSSTTGVTTLKLGSGFVSEGNSLSGVVLHATGIATGSGEAPLFFPAIESNFFPNLTARYCFASDFDLSNIYVDCDNAPSGNTLIDIYKNDSVILSGGILGTGGVLDEIVTGVTFTKGDKIKFVVTDAPDLTAGNAIYFGYY